MLEIGTKAPAFTLPDQNGEMRSLADYQGPKVIIYFYPKDMTGGCTSQACNFYDVLRPRKDGKPTKSLIQSTYLIDEDGQYDYVQEHLRILSGF